MSEVRVKSWPLAVAGSMMLHATVLTGLYVVPMSQVTGSTSKAGVAAASVLTADTAPIYLIPDELPPDVAARLEKERAASAKAPPVESAPKPKDEPALALQPPKELEPIPVPLGVVDGPKVDTMSWLKNDAKGENGGIQSVVDQPQLDLKAVPAPQGDPGQGGQDGKNGEKAAPTPPDPLRAPSPAEPVKAEPLEPMGPPVPPEPARPEVKAQAAVEPSVGPEVPKSDLQVGPSQPAVTAGNSGGETPKVQPATAPAAHPAPADGKPAIEGSPAREATAATAAPKPPSDAPGAPGSPGVPMANKTVPADRDADASSIKRAAVFRNGKVDAGEGLDIRTVRPEFNVTTKALIQPRSPTLEIIFGKDGRAKRVRVLKSSGFPSEVDAPVVNALYNWRAKGRLLDQLPSRPDATVALEITIILQ